MHRHVLGKRCCFPVANGESSHGLLMLTAQQEKVDEHDKPDTGTQQQTQTRRCLCFLLFSHFAVYLQHNADVRRNICARAQDARCTQEIVGALAATFVQQGWARA